MLCGFDWEENPEKRVEAMEKSILELKTEFVYLRVRKREKINSLEITVIIFKAYKKCKSPMQKGF